MIRPGRIVVIEYMRGLASLAVAWFHLTNGFKGTTIELSGRYGWLGVDVFFVISGFVVPYSIAKVYDAYTLSDFTNFIVRRLARLHPPYLISIALVIGLGYLSAAAPDFRGLPPDFTLPQVLAHVFYLVPLTRYDWLQPVYWTLAYEFVFYLFIALVFPWVGPGLSPLAALVVYSLAAAAIAIGILPPLSVLFLIGFLVFHLLAEGATNHQRLCAEGFLGVLGIWLLATGQHLTALVGLLSASAIYAFADAGWRNTRLERVLLFAGTISYSLYLVHVPIGGRVINLGTRFVSEPLASVLLPVCALVASLIAAALFYVFVERPSVQISRALVSRPSLKASAIG